jgi:hypothetical protein
MPSPTLVPLAPAVRRATRMHPVTAMLGLRCSRCPGSAPTPKLLGLYALPPARCASAPKNTQPPVSYRVGAANPLPAVTMVPAMPEVTMWVALTGRPRVAQDERVRAHTGKRLVLRRHTQQLVTDSDQLLTRPSRPETFPNSSPMPKPIRARSRWRRLATALRPTYRVSCSR